MRHLVSCLIVTLLATSAAARSGITATAVPGPDGRSTSIRIDIGHEYDKAEWISFRVTAYDDARARLGQFDVRAERSAAGPYSFETALPPWASSATTVDVTPLRMKMQGRARSGIVGDAKPMTCGVGFCMFAYHECDYFCYSRGCSVFSFDCNNLSCETACECYCGS